MKRQLAKMIENRRARRKDYIGPPSGRPNAMGFAERQRLKGSLLREMKQKFILDVSLKLIFGIFIFNLVCDFRPQTKPSA
jgi:hypothetical protein